MHAGKQCRRSLEKEKALPIFSRYHIGFTQISEFHVITTDFVRSLGALDDIQRPVSYQTFSNRISFLTPSKSPSAGRQLTQFTFGQGSIPYGDIIDETRHPVRSSCSKNPANGGIVHQPIPGFLSGISRDRRHHRHKTYARHRFGQTQCGASYHQRAAEQNRHVQKSSQPDWRR